MDLLQLTPNQDSDINRVRTCDHVIFVFMLNIC